MWPKRVWGCKHNAKLLTLRANARVPLLGNMANVFSMALGPKNFDVQFTLFQCSAWKPTGESGRCKFLSSWLMKLGGKGFLLLLA